MASPTPQFPCTAPQQVWGQRLWGDAGLTGPPDAGLPPPPQVPQGYNYWAEVRKLIPQLQVLDELPATHTRLPTSRKLDHDWLMVKEAIKEGSVLHSLLPGLGTDGSRPGASGWGCPRRGLHSPTPGPAHRSLRDGEPPRVASQPQTTTPPHPTPACPVPRALHTHPQARTPSL